MEKNPGRFPRYGKLFSTLWKTAGLAGLAVLGLAAAAGGAEEPAGPWAAGWDWGPVASWMEDADGNDRFRAAGPFWERAAGDGGLTLRATPRPLWARAADPANGRTAWDFVWPLAAGKTFHEQKSWRAGLAWFYDRDRTDPESGYRFWLLPLWFHGRDEQGDGYAALWPLGGEIRNFLLKDRIRFALWPLWTQSSIKDVRTTDVLWPIWSRTTTPDGRLEKFRVFPLWARSRDRGRYEKHSVLWPVWTHARWEHPKATGTAWVLFPLCGRVNLNTQKGWMVLPPLFQFIRGEQLNRTFCPWPFYQRETGAREKLYVWPLYGRRKDGVLERRFWLWPLIVHERNEWGGMRRNRWTVVPFYNNVANSVEAPAGENAGLCGEPAGGGRDKPAGRRVLQSRVKLWPLYSRIYDLDEPAYRLRLLDLWPAGHPPPVERSWAPLWTLLDYRAHGERSDLDVLWGLYRQTRRDGGARAFSLFPLWRHERTAGDAERRWSVLKGLLAWDRTATTRQVRFLWLGRVRLAAPVPADGERAETP